MAFFSSGIVIIFLLPLTAQIFDFVRYLFSVLLCVQYSRLSIINLVYKFLFLLDLLGILPSMFHVDLPQLFLLAVLELSRNLAVFVFVVCAWISCHLHPPLCFYLTDFLVLAAIINLATLPVLIIFVIKVIS